MFGAIALAGRSPASAGSRRRRGLARSACEHANARDLEVQAWTIFTHNSWLATQNPDCATRNVYGDAYWTDLCPANPRVRQYALELAKDLTRYPIRRLLAESLHYRPFEHGDHHERYLISIPPTERRLLSLCFCPHCQAAGKSAGLDTKFLAREILAALAPVWAGSPRSDTEPALFDDDTQAMLDAYTEARTSIVAGIVAEVREVLKPTGVELSFIDHGGAMAHVMLGVNADQRVIDSSLGLGIDLSKITTVPDEITALGYVDTPERLQAMLTCYRQVLGKDASLALALRPLLPDCKAPSMLAAKVAAAVRAGVTRIDFYHYAMMPLDRLDWIAGALSAAGNAAYGSNGNTI